MTLVNADTGEVVELADETEARRIADGIGVALARVNVATGDLVENVATALHRRAWVALGHGSWDDLVAAEGWEFNPRTSTERAALAKVFRESGLSFRAIGKLVSASKSTVENDLRELSNSGQLNEPEMIAGTDGKDRPARRPEPVPEPEAPEPTPEILDDDPATDLLRYRLAFTKTVTKAHEVCTFDPERVAESASLDTHGDAFVWENAQRLRESLNRWFDRLEAARPSGLRVVNGGKS